MDRPTERRDDFETIGLSGKKAYSYNRKWFRQTCLQTGLRALQKKHSMKHFITRKIGMFITQLCWRKLVTVIVFFVSFFAYHPGRVTAKERKNKRQVKPVGSISSRKQAGYGSFDEVIMASISVVSENVTIDLKADGRYIKTTHVLYKALNKTGQRILKKRTFPYHRHYNRINVKLARLIKESSQIVPVQTDAIFDTSSIQLPDMNIFDANARAKSIVFNDLEIGDTVEMVIEEECFNPPMEGAFSDVFYLQDFYPITQKSIRISVPRSMPLRFAVRDGQADFRKTESAGGVTYEWMVKDVTSAAKEPMMPPLINYAPRLVVSTIESWESVSSWYYGLSATKMVVEGPLKEKIHEVTAGLSSDQEKIAAIFEFVSQKIRYMGLGTGANKGYVPKPVQETFETRYGICRDVAALMTAMLNEAGIEAYISLTSLGYELDKEIPNLLFNHAIVAIKKADGRFVYADPTMKNTGGILISQEHDQDVLISKPSGDSLRRTPGRLSGDNSVKISAASELKADGELITRVIYKACGVYDSYFRDMFSGMSAEDLRHKVSRILQRSFPGARISRLVRQSGETLNDPFTMELEFRIKDYAIVTEDVMQVKLPLSNGGFDMLSESLFRSATLPNRKTDWNIGTTIGVVEEESLVYPAEYRVLSYPDPQKLTKGPLVYEMFYDEGQTSKASKKEISYRRKLSIDKKCLSQEEYEHLKVILKAADKSERGEVILIRSI